MPSTPTTKSQVQAYRFVLRRMQSALVRKDAVMLHDPMRTHTRATIVGVCLGAVGMIGFLIWGLLSPAPKPPDKDGIVIGQPSGAVYVLLNSTPKGQVLIPTFNLASARLLLLSRSNPEAQGVGSQVAEEGDPFGGAPAAADSPTKPKFIPDDKLEGIQRERLTGITDAPQILPEKPEQRISDNWAVCDQYQIDDSLVDPSSEDKIETTVIAGVPDLGAELETNAALLVQAPTKKHYLVYRTPESANVRNTNTVRAEVDMTDKAVTQALRLDEKDVRQITTGLLNAIPEAAPLTPPAIQGRGEPTNLDMGVDLVVGSVFEVPVPGGSEYYVVLRDGVHKIKWSTANLIRFDRTEGGADIEKVNPDRLTGNVVQNVVQEADFPANLPEVLTPTNFPTVCLGWALAGEPPNQVGQTKVYVGDPLPVELNAAGEPAVVDISTANADGSRIDHFYMPPGKAAIVRGADSPAAFATGPIYVISDRGVKYGIPDLRTAQALNLPQQTPAPDAIVRLLPNGASLNARDVLQTYDTVPVEDGQFAEQPTENGQSGG
ncbi:type VII secretion protein EccB [Actinokineospora soli]|uniref:Type VII secretion protein EccB n=1 Tax=Actinokineospora soli TaxID=1048753 RepID=A0ABW2TVK2_9PSEU